MPIYALYALLFADTGLSDAQISVLFAIWSTVGVLTEVPTGAIADRFSRRGALAAAGVMQAAGYACWVLFPGFTGFAIGFVLWGIGGSLSSGSLEALLYDGLQALGEEDQYARLNARVTAVELVAQVPMALVASVLFSLGGYSLAGWVSVGTCLASAVLAMWLPEAPHSSDESEVDIGYFATLRSGLREAAASPPVRWALLAVALVYSLDAFEEYFTLLAQDWSVPTTWVPVAVVGVPLAGAAGAALAGRWSPRPVLLLAAGLLLVFAAVIAHPYGILALALFYGLYRFVLVHVEAELQHRISGSARATVTSVAGLGSELAAFLTYAAWVLDGALAVGVLVVVIGVVILRR
ncbi:MFS transporter [Lentzea tibetensis]|uniref:MFS transporter n=1 Tax=Lentzea tibetensis TaxID=2591470 RepID=A0A563EWG1_9PSEU|nr:MFS transporter [Lentzea tibetensis]TWP52057.1 MFS transporter [Lentzea tibetensis]